MWISKDGWIKTQADIWAIKRDIAEVRKMIQGLPCYKPAIEHAKQNELRAVKELEERIDALETKIQGPSSPNCIKRQTYDHPIITIRIHEDCSNSTLCNEVEEVVNEYLQRERR